MVEKLKILILGGTGIISNKVTRRAIQEGFDIYIVNRGKRKKVKNPEIKYICADLKKEKVVDLIEKFSKYNFDVVIDFISYDLNQLKKMREIFKCKQYIFVSSATVYSEKEEGLYIESDEKENEKWSYCIDKRKCEKYLEDTKNDVTYYTIVRPYVTYSEERIPYQICPLEYYTILDRIKKDIPIVISGGDIITTVTTSEEFAIGLVGLVNNPVAYNNDFHITSNNTVKWSHILDLLYQYVGKKRNVVDISLDVLSQEKNTEVNVKELVGDKSRNMCFNNEKIMNAVPAFRASSIIDENVEEIIRYFSIKENQKVNYMWNGCLDRILYKHKKIKVHVDQYKIDRTTDLIRYYVGRFGVIYLVYRCLKKVYLIVRGT